MREEIPETVRGWTERALGRATPRAVGEAAGAIAGLIGSAGPGVVAKPLWQAVKGRPGVAARLRTAAEHADAALGAGSGPGAAGRHWGAILKGSRLIREDSEAASAHRGRHEAPRRAPAKPGRHPDLLGPGPGVAELLGDVARPAAPSPHATPPPARFGPNRPIRPYAKSTPSAELAKLEEFKRRRAAALAAMPPPTGDVPALPIVPPPAPPGGPSP